MDISFVTGITGKLGVLVLGITEDGDLGPSAARFDRETGGAIARAVAAAKFKGKAGKLLALPGPANIGASAILLAGLGKVGELKATAAEDLGAAAVRQHMTSGETLLTIAIDSPAPKKAAGADKGATLRAADLAAHIAFGASLQSYRFDHYRTALKDDQPTLRTVRIVTQARADALKAWKDLSALADGINLARDLVNEPPNILYPDEVAKRARALTKLGVTVEVLGEPQMRKLGMNLLIAVGDGSVHDSRLVVMRWNGAKSSAAKSKTKAAPLAFVGKGVCFDSGGLSLKPGNSMVGMKGDMGGAAAVVGLMHALAKRKAPVDVVGVIGLVENMPDGKAMRPNDVVKTMSGQTVEVLNTDAEGRLVLADALWYTQNRFKPRFMINLATLTGAIVVTLGHEHAGLFSNNDELSSNLAAAGRKEGETVWRLPMGDAYDRQIKSKIADMKNIGSQGAGSIVAAQFLQRFVNNVPWAHLDIAGVAWQDHDNKLKTPSWGTGWGVRLLNRLIADHYEG